MQLPGSGVFGPPKDRESALRVLRHAIDAGVNHIDTAQFYGPDVANELLREALYPYPDELVIVSKVGAARDDQGRWHAAQRPEQLRAGVEANLESLGLEQVPVVNLRRHPESDVLLTEQLDAMEALRQEGLVGRIGLSNVDLEQYRTAQSRIDIACVQILTTWPIPQERMSLTCAGRREFPSSRFFRWVPLSIPRIQFSGQPPWRPLLIDSVQRQPKWRWLGCSSRPQPYCSSPELRRWHTWRRILLLQIWCSTKKHLKCSHKREKSGGKPNCGIQSYLRRPPACVTRRLQWCDRVRFCQAECWPAPEMDADVHRCTPVAA